MSTVQNKVSRQVQLQKVLAGLGKRYPAGTAIPLGGKSYSPADFEKLVQSVLDAMAATATARDAYLAQVGLERQVRAAANPTLLRLKNYVLTTIGDSQEAQAFLGDFGYSPRKTRQPSTEVKAGAVRKAAATRKANEPASKAEPPPAVPVPKP